MALSKRAPPDASLANSRRRPSSLQLRPGERRAGLVTGGCGGGGFEAGAAGPVVGNEGLGLADDVEGVELEDEPGDAGEEEEEAEEAQLLLTHLPNSPAPDSSPGRGRED